MANSVFHLDARQMSAPTTRRSLVGILDLGSASFTCLIAEGQLLHSGSEVRETIKVLGFGQTASRGVRAGAVINVPEAERAIRIAVDAAERMAERRLRDVYVNVSAGRPATDFCSGRVLTRTGIVSPSDVEAAIAAAMAELAVGRRHVLHLMPAAFDLDGVANDDAPLGLHGTELGVDMAVVTVEPSALRNLELAVERAHLGISGYTLSPYAAGRGALSADERNFGAIVIDLGDSLTSFAIFRRGRLVFSGSLPVGGRLVTQDIAQGLSTTMAHAERMKTLFGSVVPMGHDDREYLAVPLAGEQGTDSVQKIPKHLLTAIIRPRVEETLLMARAALEPQSRLISATMKLVLTGGGSQIHGLKDLAAEVFGLQARIGMPWAVRGLPDHMKNPGSCVAAGLAAVAVRPDKTYAMPQAARDAIERANLSYARRLGRWLAEAI